jgi:hypothetical protein
MGKVEIIENQNDPTTITLNAHSADIFAGSWGTDGNIKLIDKDGDNTVQLGTFVVGKDNWIFRLSGIKITAPTGLEIISIVTRDKFGSITVNDGSGDPVLKFEGEKAALTIGSVISSGKVSVKDNHSREVFNFNGQNAALYIGAGDNEGDIFIRDNNGNDSIHLSGGAGDKKGEKARITVKDKNKNKVFDFASEHAVLSIGNKNKTGDILMRDNNGNDSIHLSGGAGDIIMGNADCAEEFDISEYESGNVESGTVMILDENGKLRVSERAYDKRVAGVISGAGSYKPGIILDRKKSRNKRMPIALMGKVYCKVDTKYSKINVGDLLTTSPTKGYAMKVLNTSKAFGSVIGKAMSSIRSRRGIIPILISSR